MTASRGSAQACQSELSDALGAQPMSQDSSLLSALSQGTPNDLGTGAGHPAHGSGRRGAIRAAEAVECAGWPGRSRRLTGEIRACNPQRPVAAGCRRIAGRALWGHSRSGDLHAGGLDQRTSQVRRADRRGRQVRAGCLRTGRAIHVRL